MDGAIGCYWCVQLLQRIMKMQDTTEKLNIAKIYVAVIEEISAELKTKMRSLWIQNSVPDRMRRSMSIFCAQITKSARYY